MAQKIRGQMMIWVFVALGITAVFVLLVTLKAPPRQQTVSVDDPVSYIQTCVRDALTSELETRLPRGGITDKGISIQYNNLSRTYYCYTKSLFEPCIMQHPLPLETMTAQLMNVTRPLVDRCFAELQTHLEATGKETIMKELSYSLAFAPDVLFITLTRPFSITDRSTTREYEEFSFTLKTPVYQLVDIAREIASQEAQFCYFEYVGYMILYPRYEINKRSVVDSTSLYTVRDVPSHRELTFATRGCALPAGI